MSIKKFLNIKQLQNEGWIDIRSFIITFTLYALICIWSANSIQSKDKELSELLTQIQKLKVKSILLKEELLDQKRRSNVLDKAAGFGFYPSKEPVKIINVKYED
jgi:cell division protein FtsL